jgi:predicted nucleic-acid-binding Zn-ribbon protein
MATSTCIKCVNEEFESKETTPRNSNFVYSFIQCTNCGDVVGVMDFYNIGNMLQQIGRKLGVNIES